MSEQTQGPKFSVVGSTGDDYISTTIKRWQRIERTVMSDVTREEMDAKLEAVEARLETRLVSMDAKLDNLLNEVRRVGESAREAKQAASSIKWNVFFAALGGIGVTASLVVAFWAIGWQIASILKP